MMRYQQYERYRSYHPQRPQRYPAKNPYRTKQILLMAGLALSLGFGGLAYTLRTQTAHASLHPTVSPSDTASANIPETPLVSHLKNTWEADLAGRSGTVDIAVYDKTTGQTAEYSNSGGIFNTASIVKLSILEKILLDNQNEGTALSGSELSQAKTMIENSNNTAATDLWNMAGAENGMDSFFKLIGATSTRAGAAGYWGLTQTTALDQLKVLNTVAYPGRILSAASAHQADNLLAKVEEDQTWGVSAGLPPDASVDLKNGWLSDSTGWYINSIGHIKGEGQDYTIAILSAGSPSETYGITTVESLASDTWQQLDT